MPQPGAGANPPYPYPTTSSGSNFPPYPTSNFGGYMPYNNFGGQAAPNHGGASGYPPYMPTPPSTAGYNNFYGGVSDVFMHNIKKTSRTTDENMCLYCCVYYSNRIPHKMETTQSLKSILKLR